MNIAGNCNIKLKRSGFILDVEFDIPARGVLGIFGNSGSGKTTLLRCLAGLETNATGNISIKNNIWLSENISLSAHNRSIGYVFQDNRLFPHMNVEKNLDYGRQRSKGRKNINKKNLLQLLDIKSLLKRNPAELSGGEIQRVAIARAILSNPSLILLDEPLASLDEARKLEILPYLDRLHNELEIPVLYVSHSLEEMSRLCDYLLVIDNGKSVYSGEIHEALVSPESPVAKSDHAAALLEGQVIKHEPENYISIIQTKNGNQFELQGLLEIDSHIRLRINASNVSISKSRPQDSSVLNIIDATISDIVDEQSSYVLLQLNCNNDIIKSRITRKSFNTLGLGVNQSVLAQIKSVSILGT